MNAYIHISIKKSKGPSYLGYLLKDIFYYIYINHNLIFLSFCLRLKNAFVSPMSSTTKVYL